MRLLVTDAAAQPPRQATAWLIMTLGRKNAHMNKPFIFSGAAIGFICGVGIIVYSYMNSPGRPGFFEWLIQIGVVAFLTASTALLGFMVGWVVRLMLPKKNEK